MAESFEWCLVVKNDGGVRLVGMGVLVQQGLDTSEKKAGALVFGVDVEKRSLVEMVIEDYTDVRYVLKPARSPEWVRTGQAMLSADDTVPPEHPEDEETGFAATALSPAPVRRQSFFRPSSGS